MHAPRRCTPRLERRDRSYSHPPHHALADLIPQLDGELFSES